MREPETNAQNKKFDKMSLGFVIPMVLFYFVVGLLLILEQNLVTEIYAWVLAGGLVIAGAWMIIRYLRSSVQQRLAGLDLADGLIMLLTGILLALSPQDMEELFPKVWGLSLVFGGFLKIQYAFDEKSVGVNRWWMMLIFAAVSLAIGVLALLNKNIFGDSQHTVIGIFMIAEAVLDLVTYLLLTNGLKKQNGPQSVPEPAAPPAQEKLPETTAEE